MTPAEVLLAAIAAHLRDDVQPVLAGFAAYQNRVATNLLQMLAREAQFGAARAACDARFAADRGLASDDPLADLARRLRDGQEKADETLLDYLRERSLRTLAIDNPRYSGFDEARGRWPHLAARMDDEAAPWRDEVTTDVTSRGSSQ